MYQLEGRLSRTHRMLDAGPSRDLRALQRDPLSQRIRMIAAQVLSDRREVEYVRAGFLEYALAREAPHGEQQ